MENEEKKTQQIPQEKRIKRRVSLFKRRKKSDIRPFVKERKHREYKKLLLRFFLIVLGLFIITALLLFLRSIVFPNIFHKNLNILNPMGNGYPDNDQIQNLLQNKGMDITRIEFASDSASVTFFIHGSTQVVLSKEKDINSQLDMADAIDRQISEDGKQAISIDLRYNKPIVRF